MKLSCDKKNGGSIGAMRVPRRSAALRVEPVALSQAKPAAAIAYTPPMKLPLRRTAKVEGDHVIINPALREWMGRR